MAKLRKNHSRQNSGAAAGGMLTKVGIFGAIAGGLYWLFTLFGAPVETQSPDLRDDYVAEEFALPEGRRGNQIIAHRRFALAYDDEHEQAEWVAYVLDGELLRRPWTKRNDNFRPDPFVKAGSATSEDYRNSGYDRGHLVAAADLAYDSLAMDETFYMSNISPQARQFNQGIWRELEETARDWAKKFDRLYVVTGPVLTDVPKGSIGRDNEISIPAAYFKVFLDLSEPELKAIGFLLPNQVSFEPLYQYAVSVDDVEDVTGIDFFGELLPADLERELERDGNIDLWPFDKKKFELRNRQWNNVN